MALHNTLTHSSPEQPGGEGNLQHCTLETLQRPEMLEKCHSWISPEDEMEPALLNDSRKLKTILCDVKGGLALTAAALNPHPTLLPDVGDQSI